MMIIPRISGASSSPAVGTSVLEVNLSNGVCGRLQADSAARATRDVAL